MRFLFVIKKFLGLLINKLRLYSFQYSWRKKNAKNLTTAQNIFPLNLVTIGKYTYGPIIVHHWNASNESLKIGDFCSIAPGSKFILGGNHRMNFLSTYPFKYFANNQVEAYSNGPIYLEDDVWLGSDVVVLSGVRLEQGCVVAAGSVVTKSFSAYSIIGGVPAKLISKRFTDDKIEILKKIKFSMLAENSYETFLVDLYTDIATTSVEDLVNKFRFDKNVKLEN